jgi:hypothetical protein
VARVQLGPTRISQGRDRPRVVMSGSRRDSG